MKTQHLFFGLCLTAAFLFGTPLHADIVSVSLGYEFSGGAPQEGAAPWMTLTFEEDPSLGTVVITIDNSGLVDAEFLTGLYLNRDPAFDVGDLMRSPVAQVGTFTLVEQVADLDHFRYFAQPPILDAVALEYLVSYEYIKISNVTFSFFNFAGARGPTLVTLGVPPCRVSFEIGRIEP